MQAEGSLLAGAPETCSREGASTRQERDVRGEVWRRRGGERRREDDGIR